ncbi:MAG: hypothetical protein JXQ82_09015 [Methanomicrobiaceae archaeon]|nr:hypothetical protein [Methanomicrobiaceae archaeon]
MAGFFKKLFSKEDDKPFLIDYNEIPGYLDTTENELSKKLHESTESSKKEVYGAIDALNKKAEAILSVKIGDNAEIPPRVRTVVEKSIPGFSGSLKKALPESLSDDPEEYYTSLVNLVSGVGKCLSSQGKYIHAAFPAEIKDIKSSVAVIGREINSMNGVIKPAIEKRGKISEVRKAYQDIDSLYPEYFGASDETKGLELKLSSNESELEKIAEMISECRKSPEFQEYERYLLRISSLLEEKEELKDSYHLSAANVSNVFRKIIYAAEKDGNSKFAKDLYSFDSLLISGGKKDTESLLTQYSGLYPEIKRYMDANPGTLKNKSEERLLCAPDALPVQISDICSKYGSVSDEIRHLKELVSSFEQAEKLSVLEGRFEEIKKENNFNSSRIFSLLKRQEEISEIFSEYCDKLESAMSDLSEKKTLIENMPVC